MKRYIFTIVYMLVALSLAAQSEQLNGAPANVEAVDLGLPSGTRWASCNVGATKPEEFGGYFAWGETEAKIEYLLENYKYKDVDLGNDICGTPYDVAHVKWGKNWRMPTLKEIEELVDNCTYTVTELNFVQVMKMTGPNGNSIYLPFTGYMDGTECTSIGHGSGYYWSGVNTYTNTFAPCMTPSASGNISYNNGYILENKEQMNNAGDTIRIRYRSGEEIYKSSNQFHTISNTAIYKIYELFHYNL